MITVIKQLIKQKLRKKSLFTCYNLGQYSYHRPRLSRLRYQFPLQKLSATTDPSKKLFDRLQGEIKKIGLFTVEIGSPTHVGPHSAGIDFIVPEDSAVLAAADGQVVEVVNNFSIPKPFRKIGNYRLTRIFRGGFNYITIRHFEQGVEEFTQYGHLKKDSADCRCGQKIKAGEIIARTGWSGWMDRPHLHFIVYRRGTKQFPKESHQSIKPLWRNQS